ncbi:hypothetical protein Pfo_005266, partial [Paulownia fortunei]
MFKWMLLEFISTRIKFVPTLVILPTVWLRNLSLPSYISVYGFLMFGEATNSQFALNLPTNLVTSDIARWAVVRKETLCIFYASSFFIAVLVSIQVQHYVMGNFENYTFSLQKK